jgi:exopolysaccharide/PEP-CTERM locus tyrosine autokinase
MSLIEKAAQRLEQLKRAGIDPAAPSAEVEEPVQTAMATATPVARATEGAKLDIPVRQNRADRVIPPAQEQPAAPVTPNRQRRTSQVIEIDPVGLQLSGFLSPHAPNSLLAQEMRIIKRPLLRNAQGKGGPVVENGNLIMVTSAMPSEGKSFISLNLALSIATELDSTVLFIDADVVKPSVPRMLDIPSGPGLLDLLTDPSVEVPDVLLKTNIEKFSVMRAGTSHPRAAELLASDAMANLVAELGRRYPDRIIVFDSPPLLVTTESRVLASHMGQILVVVEEGRTRVSAAKEALAAIESCPVVMTVLNKSSGAAGKGYYGYGYGYGYGHGRSGDGPGTSVPDPAV